jgi:hypothetical protein
MELHDLEKCNAKRMASADGNLRKPSPERNSGAAEHLFRGEALEAGRQLRSAQTIQLSAE